MDFDNMAHAFALDAASCRLLAETLGETPETVISIHLLRRGLCSAYVAGSPTQFDAAIVQARSLPSEPVGFGSDPQVLWESLQSVCGWDCILVDTECARPLGRIIKQEMGVAVHYLDDVCHTLTQPATYYEDGAVRQLTLRDLELLASAPAEFRDASWEDTKTLLRDGIIACAIVSGEIVATALTTARGDHYADVGVYTHPDFRRRGLATAAASAVLRRVQQQGQTPVWGAGAHNTASLRVAQKLGFKETSRRTYVILDKDG
jgi:RimJ/RimL family protein N-acetyltransferase